MARSPLLMFMRSVVIYCIGIFWSFFVFLQCIRLAITKREKFFAQTLRRKTPSCLKDPVYGEHKYAKLSEVKLHYVLSGPKDAPLVVMLHGFPEFWYSWRHQIKEFNKKYRVAAVDLRGYGWSSNFKQVEEYTITKLTKDIAELIPALGYESAIVMGHDWGGVISWTLAAQNPELVDKLVVMNCPQPGAFQDHLNRSWGQFMKSWYMFFVNIPYFPEWFFTTGDCQMLKNAFQGKMMGTKPGAITEEDLEAFKFNLNMPWDFTGPMNYIRCAIRGMNSGKDARKPVKGVPVLLVWGTRDGALSKEMAELSKNYSDDFTLKFVEGASHWVQQDEPEIVNKYTWEFLERKRSE